MLEAIGLIFICQLAGEVTSRLLSLSVPGPVLGMAILFVGLQVRRMMRPEATEIAATPLGVVALFFLAHLSLLFVPAGVGIVGHLPTLATHGPGLIVALVASTLLSLAVTAKVFAVLARRFDTAPKP